MNPTQQAVLLIVNQVSGNIPGGFPSGTDIQLTADLNALSAYANPTPQGVVYKTYDANAIVALMPTGLLNTFMYIPDFGDVIIPIMNTQPKTAAVLAPMISWFGRCSGAQIISTQVYIGATGYLAGTLLDPTWPSSVSWANYNLGRPVDLGDMAVARGYYNQYG